MPQHPIGILGAGRQALETGGYCEELGLGTLFFLELEPPVYSRDVTDYGAPIYRLNQVHELDLDVPVITAVGSPALKRVLLGHWPGSGLATIVSERAWVARDACIGPGTTVAPFVAVNRKAHIGQHVLVNVGVIVSHDVQVADFVTLSPRCVVGGGVCIGEGAFLGIGSTIRDHVQIGAGATVAAGAVVVGDVEANQTVMGVPARASAGSGE